MHLGCSLRGRGIAQGKAWCKGDPSLRLKDGSDRDDPIEACLEH
jgi:hypothetical protein